MLNLTPHAISIYDEKSDKYLTLPASGVVARVSAETTELGFVAVEGLPVPLVKNEYGAITGLPADGQNCLVSGMVLAALQANPRAGGDIDLSAVFAPDTGPTAIRNEKGQITAVTRLLSAI